MASYVALLRAVNVGGVKVEMAALRRALEGLGYGAVRTYVQSGNVVFEADGGEPAPHAAAIEELLGREFGVRGRVLVLTAERLAAIAAADPFTGADEKLRHVTFLFDPVEEVVWTTLRLPAADGEQAAFSGKAIYLYLPHGYGRSKLNNAYFERVLAATATTRNRRTVAALVELAGAPV